MKTLLFVVLLCAAAWTGARAAGFTDAQHELLDGIVGRAVNNFRQDPGHLDAMLVNLSTAYTASGYDKEAGSVAVLQQLRDQAAVLKEEIVKLDAFVAAHRAEDRDPAVMLLLLSREQATDFHLYRWIRTATELIDLASASIRRHDPTAEKFATELIQTAEAAQETFATAIQGLTGVVGQPKP